METLKKTNTTNPEAYFEPCQAPKMEVIRQIVIAINYFHKKLHLKNLTGFYYAAIGGAL